jgi:hypothetical protein
VVGEKFECAAAALPPAAAEKDVDKHTEMAMILLLRWELIELELVAAAAAADAMLSCYNTL